ncbi:Mitogen-activated protein kinase 9, partial [Clarias magur]
MFEEDLIEERTSGERTAVVERPSAGERRRTLGKRRSMHQGLSVRAGEWRRLGDEEDGRAVGSFREVVDIERRGVFGLVQMYAEGLVVFLWG